MSCRNIIVALCALVSLSRAEERHVWTSPMGYADVTTWQPTTTLTNSVLWLSMSVDPTRPATWTVPSGTDGNNGVQGTANSRPVWSSGTLSFDGVDDHFTNGTQSTFAFVHNTAVFTVSAWCKFSATNKLGASICGNAPNTTDKGFFLIQYDDDFYFQSFYATAGQQNLCLATSVIQSTNDWYFVCVVGTGTSITLYWNAVAKATDSSITTASGNATYPLLVGVLPGASLVWFHGGKIDDLRISNRALTAGEVTNLYNSTISPTPARP